MSDLDQVAREMLAAEYDRGGGEGPYPTYAALARTGYGEFTLCSIRAIKAAILAERERCAAIAEDRAPVIQCMSVEPIVSACLDIAESIRS